MRWSKTAGIIVTAVGVGAFVCLLAVRHVLWSHQQQMARIASETQNLAAILDLTVAGMLDGINLSLQAVATEVECHQAREGWSSPALTAMVTAQRRLVPSLESLGVADVNGRVQVRAGPPTSAPINVLDREYFQRALAGQEPGMIVCAPVVSRSSGRWVLPVARRLNDPAGAFAGVVIGTIPLDHLREVFRPLELGSNDRIGIRDGDFRSLVQFPEQVTQVGGGSLSAETQDNLRRHPERSYYLTRRKVDGVYSAVAYRRLAVHPLYIIFALSVDDHLATWRRERLVVMGLSAAFLAALVVVTSLLVRAWRRSTAERRAAEEREREFRDTLEFFPLPVGMVGADRLSLHVNQSFVATFGYAAGVVATVDAWVERAFPDPVYRQQVVALWDADLAAARSAGSSTPGREYLITCRDGGQRTVVVCARHLGGRQVVVFQDITERNRAEEALRASEALLRELFDHNRDGFVVIDPQGRFVDANTAFCAMIGYARDELLKLDDFYAITPARWHQWEREEIVACQLAKRGYTDLYEKEFIRKDGVVIPIEMNCFAVHAGDGTVRHFWGMVREISERRRAQDALHASERQFREAIEFLPVAVGISGSDQVLRVCNRMFCELFGYAQEELGTVERWLELVFPDPEVRARVVRDRDLDLMGGGGSPQLAPAREYPAHCKDGTLKQVVIRRRLIEGRVFAVFEDVTAQRRSEEQLRQHREHLEELVLQRSQELDRERWRFEQYFTLARVLTVVLDLQGRVERINPYGSELLGWPAEALVGCDWFATCLRPEDAVQAYAAFQHQIQVTPHPGIDTVASGSFENTIRAHDGELRSMIFRHAWLRGEGGTVSGVLYSAIDITPLRQAEKELNQAKVAAERANQAKSAFLASMSHEIRTPLNAVLGYAQLMARDPTLAAAHRRAVEVINRSGEHLLQLINDILEMSRIEAGRSACNPEDFDLDALLDNLASMFRQRAADKGLQLELGRGPRGRRFLRTDQRKLRQILINLLANAVKFTTVGRIAVTVRIADRRLVLAVQDSGCGIAPAEHDRLFQPFVQAEGGRRRGDGTGLGLALSHGFARVLGGSLTVESELGSGTTFTLDIPVEEAAGAPTPPSRSQVVGLSPGQAPPVVLVADDHRESRELLCDLMRGGGCLVEGVADGAAAVAACRRRRPDLVWMDIDMPVMDGLAAAKAIRTLGESPPVIVALTAAAFSEDRQRILANGCDEVESKPFREEDLFRLLERRLGVSFQWLAAAPSAAAPAADPGRRDEALMVRRLAAVPQTARSALASSLLTGDVDRCHLQLAGWQDRAVAAWLGEALAAFAFERLQGLLAAAEEGAA